MEDLDAFLEGLDRFKESIDEGVEAVQQDLFDRLGRDLVDGTPDELPGTPVLTGNCRANWFPSWQTPSTEYEELGIVSEHGKKREFVLAPGAAAEASLGRMEDVLAEASAASVLGILYWTNNTPYAWALEHGHSKQAPNGFVGLAVDSLAILQGGSSS